MTAIWPQAFLQNQQSSERYSDREWTESACYQFSRPCVQPIIKADEKSTIKIQSNPLKMQVNFILYSN